jgi:hypothetical protein
MDTRIFRLSLALFFFFLLALTGCGGGGGAGPVTPETSTPEAVVAELFNSWRQSQVFRFDAAQGKIVAQESTASESRYISFRDMSGTTWQFKIDKVEYFSANSAAVHTSYYYSGAPQFGGLKVSFMMIKDSGAWFLNSLVITQVPAVVVVGTGINGIITDKVSGLPVSGARVEIYNASEATLAGFAVSDSSGYYEINELLPGSYYVVISRDGFAPYTISGIQVS